MSNEQFQLKGEYILLNSLLKITGLAQTGGHAGLLISEGQVKVNGDFESRKRRKCRIGDRVQVNEHIIIIV
ncbi:MAG: RNA-binding S4 domain-containing protein [Flavobacteriales bacterium]|nr:RNA-binding S4 domain-containing protein [Flavobacteriales bacterium]NNK80857.1 RNA-binding S4 domain-containing protein [Flavobacteriales bacterium]